MKIAALLFFYTFFLLYSLFHDMLQCFCEIFYRGFLIIYVIRDLVPRFPVSASEAFWEFLDFFSNAVTYPLKILNMLSN